MGEVVKMIDQDVRAVDAYTKEQVDLIKSQIAKGCTDIELNYFLTICQTKGLDPFSNQIYAIKYNGKLTIITSISGLRAIAERTGELDGQSPVEFCGDDGVWKDAWLDKTLPQAAKVTVYRKNCRYGFTAVIRTSEFKGSSPNWSKMPVHMIAKVVQAHALKMAFPQDLAGIEGSGMEQGDDAIESRSEIAKELSLPTQEAVLVDSEVEEDPAFDITKHKDILLDSIRKLGKNPDGMQGSTKQDLVFTLKESGTRLSELDKSVECFLNLVEGS